MIGGGSRGQSVLSERKYADDLHCRTVEESEPPESNGRAGRLAWSSKTDEGLEIYHAWVVEDLEGQRVRVLTQESQIGGVFGEWEGQKPNKMLLGHQDWLGKFV